MRKRTRFPRTFSMGGVFDSIRLCCERSLPGATNNISRDDDRYLISCILGRKLYIIESTRHVLQWASSQIRKSSGCACAGNAGNVFPATDVKGNRRDVCRDR